jgi:NitT/TauT family transport system permease protein
MRNRFAPVISLATFIGGWYALAYSLDRNFATNDGSALIVPPPHRLFEGLNDRTIERISIATGISVATAFVGLVIAVIVGSLLGLFMASTRSAERAVWPWLIALQVTPVIVLTPIIVRILGPSFGARVFVTVIVALFPIASNVLFGVRSIPQPLRDLFVLRRASNVEVLRELWIPAALPSFFAGLRISAGLAVIGSIVGDFFFTRGEPGLGRLINYFFLDTRSGPMFVTAMVASLIGLLFFAAAGALRKLVVDPWNQP